MAQTFSFPNYGLFNATYYLQQNPDVATSWTGTPLQHYIQYGALEGRAPTAWFNADFYRASYTDLQSMNALQLFNHYCNYGYNEGRVPMLNFSNFNGVRYLLDNPDVAAAGYTAANAISHYVNYGEYEGRAAYATNGVVIDPVVNEGNLYYLTTNVDSIQGTQFNDTFDASQPGTLQNFDSLDGMGGVDTLYATVGYSAGTLTPMQLSNIEVINASAYSGAQNATLNLINAGQVTNVNNNASLADLSFTNIAAGADLAVSNTADDTVFAYANTTGTQSVDLAVNGVTATAGNGANITIAGVETINVTSTGDASSIDLVADAANTLNFAGNANLTVGDLNAALTRSVSSINASSMTGDFTITVGAQTGVPATTNISVQGGLGNDSITMTGVTQKYAVTLGAGNDIVIDTGVATTDSITGGLGEDTLSTTAANAVTLSATTPTTYNITGMDQLTLSTALATGANVQTQNIDTSIDTVNAAGTAAGATATLTMGAGSAAVNLTAELGAASTLVVADTGVGITDTVTISDAVTDGTVDVFGGSNVTSTGYENVIIDVSNGAWTDTSQDIGTLTITADAASAPVSVTLVGDNDASINAFSTNSTGLTTINASGIAAGTDSPMFTLGGTALGVGGTQSIVGTGGRDVISVGAYASTIVAGAGNDFITGSTANDSIDGGAGDDSLVGAGGNDTIHGGEGNDTIETLVAGTVSVTGGAGDDLVNIGATITSGDVLDGGTGTNTLAYSQQVISAYAGATNFSKLRLDTGVTTQNVALFTGTTFSEVELADTTVATSYTLQGLADATAIHAQLGAVITATHATDTATNSLTIGGLDAAGVTINAVTANDSNTLTFTNGHVTAGNQMYVTALDAIQATQINFTGSANEYVGIAASGSSTGFGTTARAITVDGSANTGTVYFNGATAIGTQALTVTGSATAANTLVGGDGNDVITGGAVADSLVGGAGNDAISGGAGNDSITGGDGADTISFGAGTDTAVYTAAGQTATNLVASGVTVLTGIDTIANAGAGDIIDGNVNFTGAVGTSLITTGVHVAGTTAVVRGDYNVLTGIFTTSTTGADTLVQYCASTTDASVQDIVLVGYATAGAASIVGNNLVIG